MSAPSSPEQDSWTGDSPSPDSTTPGSASPTLTAAECSSGGGPASQSSRTYERSRPQRESLFSLEASRAKTSVRLVDVPGLQASAQDYGLTSPAWLTNYDPSTSLWRTWQTSLSGAWAAFLATWPMSGMTRSGIAFRLRPSVPHTFEPASSYWPTPVAEGDRKTIYKQGGIPLGVAVRREPWPTPTASDARKGYSSAPGEKNWRGLETLSGAVNGMFKTPTAAPFSHGGSGGELHAQVAPGGGPLSPMWVEWLMGLPIGWTDLALSETASSLRSRGGSGNESLSVKP